MCGISGAYSTSLTAAEEKLFGKLLMLNVFRGEHSTGVVKVPPSGKAHVLKSVTDSMEFLASKRGKDFLFDTPTKQLFIGHCRYATMGEVSLQNAHPFNFANVVGVHNGTIRGTFEGSKEYGTDSEALYALINEKGIVEALNEIEHLDPSYALVWYDKREKTINFVRNNKRPLWFSYVANRQTLVWSSTKESIDFAVAGDATFKQSGWHAKDVSDKHFFLNPHDLLTIKLGNVATSGIITSLPIKAKHTKVVTVYSGGRVHNVAAGYNGWIQGTDGMYRPREEEEARLLKLAEESAFYLDGSDADDSTPEVGGFRNFRQSHGSELADLPWLRKTPEQEGTKTTKTTAKSGAEARAQVASEQAKASAGVLAHQVNKEVDARAYGTFPISEAEEAFKLTLGCFCCGDAVAPTNIAAREKVRWWSRDHYACGTCYENSYGDWVRKTIDGDWELAVPPNSVSVH